MEAFNQSNGCLQKRTTVPQAQLTLRTLQLQQTSAILLKFKDCNAKIKENNTSNSLIKIILYKQQKEPILQKKNYTLYSNFATQGKLTIRVSGYQFMISGLALNSIVAILRLLAPKQLNKHIKLHTQLNTAPPSAPFAAPNTSDAALPLPLHNRTNLQRRRPARFKVAASSSTTTSSTSSTTSSTTSISSPRIIKPVRQKTSFSNRSPAPVTHRLQDDRLASSPTLKRNKSAASPLSSIMSSSSSSTSTSFTSSSTTSSLSTANGIELSYDQEQAFHQFQQGTNLFITGPGGTGKSVLINKCVEWSKARKKTISITATTGVAACNINGETLHAWSGISSSDIDQARIIYNGSSSSKSTTGSGGNKSNGNKSNGSGRGGGSGADAGLAPLAALAVRHRLLGDYSVSIVRKLKRSSIDRWRKNQILIIDEISMMDDVTMDLLDLVGQL